MATTTRCAQRTPVSRSSRSNALPGAAIVDRCTGGALTVGAAGAGSASARTRWPSRIPASTAARTVSGSAPLRTASMAASPARRVHRCESDSLIATTLGCHIAACVVHMGAHGGGAW